jgi:hypothetical protein
MPEQRRVIDASVAAARHRPSKARDAADVSASRLRDAMTAVMRALYGRCVHRFNSSRFLSEFRGIT